MVACLIDILFIVGNLISTKLFITWWKLRQQYNDQENLYFFPITEEKVKKKLCQFLIIFFILLSSGYTFNFKVFCATFFHFLICRLFLLKLCPAEAFDIAKHENLNIGYGLALGYYENYLKIFFPREFLERIESFKERHRIELDSELLILAPKSCKIHSDIDNEPHIERCRELPRTEVSVAGIKKRIYNITVYLVRCFNDNTVNEDYRLAIEYAMPLKALMSLKNKKIINEDKMHLEYEAFCDTFESFLHDENDLYKYCKLVKYEDEKVKLHTVLLKGKTNL